MIWSMLRVTVIFFSHLLTLPLMDDPKSDIKHPNLWWVASFALIELISFIVILIVGDFNLISGGILLVLSSLIYGYIFIRTSSGPVMKNIFIVTSYYTYYMFAADLALLIATQFAYSELLSLILILVIVIIYSLLLRFRIAALIRESTEGIERGWNGMMCFALITFLSVSSLILLSLFHTIHFAISLLIFISMFLIVTSAFGIVFVMIRLLNERQDVFILRSQQKLVKSELEAVEEFVDSAKRYRHDMKHHSRLILQYAEDGDIEGIKSYLAEFSSALDDTALPAWCGNKVVNAMMRIASRRCSSLSIALDARIDIPENLPLSGPELGTIFGNLIENAIEASSVTRNPFIMINVRTEGDKVLGAIRNSMAGKARFDGSFPVSLKKDGGIGLRSVATILYSYSGMLHCAQEGNTFIAQFVIPL